MPSPEQLRLLRELALRSGLPELDEGWLASVTVRPMQDGGMGSMHLHSPLNPSAAGPFFRGIAEVWFDDVDGVRVFAYLNANPMGAPFELDVWKTDFQPLLHIPDSFPEPL